MTPDDLDWITRLLSQRTAPFREERPLAVARAYLESHGVAHFQDPAGNLIVGARDAADYARRRKRPARGGARGGDPLRVYIAHLDHPGFLGEEWIGPGLLRMRGYGGLPTQALVGVPIEVVNRPAPGRPDWRATGRIAAFALPSGSRQDPDPRQAPWGSVDTIEALFEEAPGNAAPGELPDAASLYGSFSFFKPVWRDGDVLRTQAADDLIGAFAILRLAARLRAQDPRRFDRGDVPFLGLLTRGEEVGFIGAIAHLETGWLEPGRGRRPTLVVSLETSRTLPGAEIGRGPIVRLGDAFTVFDPGALRVFTRLAQDVLPGAHQRRIMDGGSCEASAATVYGLPCVGISVPLGNYHNQSLEGGPESSAQRGGVAPEFVHLGDLAGLCTLTEALMRPKLAWAAPWEERRKFFRAKLKRAAALLKPESRTK